MFIFSDGPKKESDIEKVSDVRNYIKSINQFASVDIVESERNKGLANSVISGVTKVVSEYSKVIVLEDDIVTSPFFLDYMNDGLSLYENNPEIMSISGYVFPCEYSTEHNTFFLTICSSWGWATWERAWMKFEKNATILYSEIKRRKLSSVFDFNSSYPFMSMLMMQKKSAIDSWAVRWYATCFLLGGKTLFPKETFVQNIGFDGTGTHCGRRDVLEDKLTKSYVKLLKHDIFIDEKINESIEAYFRKNNLQRNCVTRFVLDSIKYILPPRLLKNALAIYKNMIKMRD